MAGTKTSPSLEEQRHRRNSRFSTRKCRSRRQVVPRLDRTHQRSSAPLVAHHRSPDIRVCTCFCKRYTGATSLHMTCTTDFLCENHSQQKCARNQQKISAAIAFPIRQTGSDGKEDLQRGRVSAEKDCGGRRFTIPPRSRPLHDSGATRLQSAPFHSDIRAVT